MDRFSKKFNITTLEDLCLFNIILNKNDIASLNHKYLNKKHSILSSNLKTYMNVNKFYRDIIHEYFLCEKITYKTLMLLYHKVFMYMNNKKNNIHDVHLKKMLEHFDDKHLNFIFRYFLRCL